MISPIIVATSANPVSNMQQNTESQSVLNTQAADVKVKEEERQIRESVVNKDEAVFYDQKHDAKEEGRNKYANLYTDKKKKPRTEDSVKNNSGITRVNIKL